MGLEVYEYNGAGYNATMHFEDWRVAMINFGENFDKPTKMSRHMLTDEVFVLLQGTATLIIGENAEEFPLEKNKIYNVTKATWHALEVSRDAKVLVVENHNTCADNSEDMPRPAKK